MTSYLSVKNIERNSFCLKIEVKVALPKEFSLDQNKVLLKDFVNQNFINERWVTDIMIHSNEHNHAHIILTHEIIDDDSERKVRGWDNKEQLLKWRKSWADIIFQNKVYQ